MNEEPHALIDVYELRKEFNALQTVKDFSIISGGLGKVLTSAKDPSGAGDISLLFAYMKTLCI